MATLRDFAAFLTDESGVLRRYLFDSNVRDFVGLNRVNDDIARTLRSEPDWDFWWLNNGVTIIASRALLSRDSIHVDDVQVVNGLQTSESIFNYFRAGGDDPGSRVILVKVVETSDDVVRDEIIRATNNQTEVQQASLHATDETQRRIEQALERHNYYYDRRKSYHHNRGRPDSQIVSMLEAAAANVALVLKAPLHAAKLKQKFMRSEGKYSRVFSPQFPLDAWAPMIALFRGAGRSLARRKSRGDLPGTVRFQKNWGPLLAIATAGRLAGTFNFAPLWLVDMDTALLTDELFDDTWKFIEDKIPERMFLGRRTQQGGW